MESKKINQLATELSPALSDLTIIGDPTTGVSKKITLSQMASLFTGTVEEYANLAAFPLVGVADTIYIALDTNVLYRWNTGTSAYVELSPNIINSLVFSDANGFDGTISLVGSVATLTITTALTQGSVPFIGASGALSQDNANLFFDDTNNRLGINTNAPTTALDVFGSGIIGRLNGTSTNNAFLGFGSAGTNRWSIGNVQSDHRFRIYNEAATSELVSVLSTGEFGIGIANPLTKLHIFGGSTALIANLDANTSVAKSISYRSGNSSRINLEVSGTESGSNAGANFFLRTYTDAGSLLETPLQITRSTGLSTFKNIAITGLTTNKVLKSNGSSTIVESTITDDGTNVAITGGFAASTYLTAASATITTAGKDGLIVSDSTTQATGVGGSILFKGVYTTGGSPLSFGRISLMKENSTNANYSFGLGFYTSANGGSNPSSTPNMYLSGAGYLGIGTITPQSIFHIGANAPANSGLKPYTGLANSYEGFLFDYYYNTAASNLRVFDIVALGASTTGIGGSDIRFLTVPQTTTGTPIERLRIASNGTSQFTGPNGGNIVRWTDNANNTGYLYIRATTAGVGADNNFTIETAATERFRIESGGLNTFIGKNATGNFQMSVDSFGNYLFHNGIGGGYRNFVNQARATYMLTNDAGTTGMYMANGGSSWNVFTSDIRVKKNFEPSQGLNELLQIEPVKYHMKTDEDNAPKRLGFKAQNLLPLIPEMVTTNPMALDENGKSLYTITPDYLLPVLVKAIQEQQAQIEVLKTLINK